MTWSRKCNRCKVDFTCSGECPDLEEENLEKEKTNEIISPSWGRFFRRMNLENCLCENCVIQLGEKIDPIISEKCKRTITENPSYRRKKNNV